MYYFASATVVFKDIFVVNIKKLFCDEETTIFVIAITELSKTLTQDLFSLVLLLIVLMGGIGDTDPNIPHIS